MIFYSFREYANANLRAKEKRREDLFRIHYEVFNEIYTFWLSGVAKVGNLTVNRTDSEALYGWQADYFSEKITLILKANLVFGIKPVSFLSNMKTNLESNHYLFQGKNLTSYQSIDMLKPIHLFHRGNLYDEFSNLIRLNTSANS